MHEASRKTRFANHIRIPALYAAIGAAYILISTWLMDNALGYSAAIARVETLKGLIFVGVTTAALWFVLWRQHRRHSLSEITFQQLVESLQDAVFVMEMPARRIVYANLAVCEMTGYSRSELIGETPEKTHVSIEHFRRFGELFGPAIERGETFRGDFELRHKNGTVFPTHHTLSSFTDQRGRRYAVSIVHDMTETHEYLRTIRESEERFRQIAENLREVFWIADPGRNGVEYVSPAYRDVWGREPDVLYEDRRHFMDAIHPDDRDRVAEQFKKQTGDDYDVIYRIVRPDGAERWIRDRAVPIRNEAGRVVRIVGIAEDITDFKRREAELRQAQKMEAMGQLTGGIAHDFNNLLMVIMANAEALAESLGEREPQRSMATSIMQSGEHAADLIARLLTFARERPLKTEACDLNTLIRETVRMLQRTLGSNIKIELKLAENLWPIAVDRVQMETSIINLATNARDAMAHGGTISIVTRNCTHDEVEKKAAASDIAPGDYVELTVRDTGTGMTPEVLARVFEPFFTTKEPGRGTGLGLPMIYGFVKQSGGQVAVESSPGVGTVFRLYMPRHRDPEEAQD